MRSPRNPVRFNIQQRAHVGRDAPGCVDSGAPEIAPPLGKPYRVAAVADRAVQQPQGACRIHLQVACQPTEQLRVGLDGHHAAAGGRHPQRIDAAIGTDIDKGASRRHPAEEALHLDRVEAVGAQEQPGVGHIARAIQPPAQPEAPHIRHLAGRKPLIEPSKPPEDPLPGPAVSVEPRHEPVQPPLQGIRAVGAEGAGVVNGGRHRTANPGCRPAVGEDVATLVRRHVRAARIGTPPGYPACGE